MEMTPQAVRSTGFKLVKRGYDPEEVDAFKEQVAGAVEFAQNQATAMEARARAETLAITLVALLHLFEEEGRSARLDRRVALGLVELGLLHGADLGVHLCAEV
jgi:DivIVA domain-containing protein